MAIAWALDLPTPCVLKLTWIQASPSCIAALAADTTQVVTDRLHQLEVWRNRAVVLLPQTDQLLQRVPDAALRRLLRGQPDGSPCQLGSCCHVSLYYEMLEACGSVDRYLPDLLLQGFPIVEPIARSRRWPDYDKPQRVLSVDHACQRAWEIRAKDHCTSAESSSSENLQKLWDSTLEDVAEGSSLGPMTSIDEVSNMLGCTDWIPTQRFEAVQKNKVRGCDSATTNLINQITRITEKTSTAFDRHERCCS